jgi:hypothetical protein
MKINPLGSRSEAAHAAPAEAGFGDEPPRPERPPMQAAIDERVDAVAHEAVARLAALSARPYFRSAIMKAALDEMCQRFSELEGVSRDDLAEHLIALARRLGGPERQRGRLPGAEDPSVSATHFGGTSLRN